MSRWPAEEALLSAIQPLATAIMFLTILATNRTLLRIRTDKFQQDRRIKYINFVDDSTSRCLHHFLTGAQLTGSAPQPCFSTAKEPRTRTSDDPSLQTQGRSSLSKLYVIQDLRYLYIFASHVNTMLNSHTCSNDFIQNPTETNCNGGISFFLITIFLIINEMWFWGDNSIDGFIEREGKLILRQSIREMRTYWRMNASNNQKVVETTGNKRNYRNWHRNRYTGECPYQNKE